MLNVTSTAQRIGLKTATEQTETAYPNLTPVTYTHTTLSQLQGHNVNGHSLHQ